MAELLIKDAEVFDPATGLRGRRDVAIEGGRIARLLEPGHRVDAQRVIQLPGKLIVPGLVDFHVHVHPAAVRMAIDTDLAGVLSGATTVVDCGSTGCYNFLPPSYLPRTRTRVLYYLHIARTGVAFTPELREEQDVNLEATLATLRRFPHLIKGIKMRAVSTPPRDVLLRTLQQAKQMARGVGGRLAIHIGDHTVKGPLSVTRDVLRLLDPGDIIAHCFTGQPGKLLGEDGRVLPEVPEARKRGVMLDAAHGWVNLDFPTARRLLDQGVVPDVISSDIHAPSRYSIVFSLTDVMSKFLALGFRVEDVIRMTTVAPARLLGMEDQIGSVQEGREADLTVLDIATGKWKFVDSHGNTLVGDKVLVPVLTVRAGEPITPDWGPHPRGWLPEEAS